MSSGIRRNKRAEQLCGISDGKPEASVRSSKLHENGGIFIEFRRSLRLFGNRALSHSIFEMVTKYFLWCKAKKRCAAEPKSLDSNDSKRSSAADFFYMFNKFIQRSIISTDI